MISTKNLLLINPWIYDFTAYDFWMKPLGLLYVASLLERDPRLRVSFVDCLDRRHPGLAKPLKTKPDGRGPFPKEIVEKPPILKDVPRRFSRYGIPLALFEHELERVPRPDAVLITCTMTYWYPGVQLAVDLVRRRFGGVPIILGGIYPTLCPGHAKAQSGADAVVVGPAERTLWPVLSELLGETVAPSAQYDSLDDLPAPAFAHLRDKTWLPVLTSRGCPFRCTFCASSLLSPRFEQRGPEATAGEIAASHARFGTRHFAFYDDALLLNKETHIIPLLERIAGLALPIRFHSPNGLHIKEIDERTAGLLKAAGVSSLYLSLESVDEALVSARTPKTSPSDLARALAVLEDAGYARKDISVYLIMGLPGQGTASVVDSIRFVRGLGAVPRVAFFSPIPGTEEWSALSKAGTVGGDTDPLLHNKIAFAYLKADFSAGEFEAVKGLFNEA